MHPKRRLSSPRVRNSAVAAAALNDGDYVTAQSARILASSPAFYGALPADDCRFVSTRSTLASTTCPALEDCGTTPFVAPAASNECAGVILSGAADPLQAQRPRSPHKEVPPPPRLAPIVEAEERPSPKSAASRMRSLMSRTGGRAKEKRVKLTRAASGSRKRLVKKRRGRASRAGGRATRAGAAEPSKSERPKLERMGSGDLLALRRAIDSMDFVQEGRKPEGDAKFPPVRKDVRFPLGGVGAVSTKPPSPEASHSSDTSTDQGGEQNHMASSDATAKGGRGTREELERESRVDFNLGKVYLSTGHPRKAKGCFRHALRARLMLLGANSFEVAAAHEMLGDANIEIGNIDRAQKHYKAVMRIVDHATANGQKEIKSRRTSVETISEDGTVRLRSPTDSEKVMLGAVQLMSAHRSLAMGSDEVKVMANRVRAHLDELQAQNPSSHFRG